MAAYSYLQHAAKHVSKQITAYRLLLISRPLSAEQRTEFLAKSLKHHGKAPADLDFSKPGPAVPKQVDCSFA